MTHADDDGMVLPPQLAPQHVVILPIFRSDDENAARARLLHAARDRAARAALRRRARARAGRRARRARRREDVGVDQEGRAAAARGRPARHRQGLRVRRPPRPARRRTRQSVPRGEFVATIAAPLDSRSRTACSTRAKAFREQHTRRIDTKDEFYAFFTASRRRSANDPTPIHGGFALTHFNGDADARGRRSRTTSASRCAASRSRPASPAPARSPASRARSASCGRRRTERVSPRAIVVLLAAVLIAALAGAAALVWIGSETAGPEAAGEERPRGCW